MTRTDRPLDNPINWSFRVGRLFGIHIRIHIAFVVCAVVLVWMERTRGDGLDPLPLGDALLNALGVYAVLFLVVLLHELGHCLGARATGGEANEILIWPLGGLAYVNPPRHPTAHMVTAVAGPAVNVLICAFCTAVLVAWTGKLGAVPWNPIHPLLPVDRGLPLGEVQWGLVILFGVSYFLLLVNLLPIFPFDGGRMLQAWLWATRGYRPSLEIATGTGMVGALLIGLFALFIEESWLLLMIAVFGYMNCWQTRRMLREQEWLDAEHWGFDFSSGYTVGDGASRALPRKPGYFARRRARKAAQEAERQRLEDEARQRILDEILRKVSERGLASLSPRERRMLEEETERRRNV